MSPDPLTLLAFGWLNLPMLGWLLAAAAPLLIHLWSRRRYREVPWAAMQYLLAAIRRRYRRWQVEQWLLLLLRTLLIVLLVLAVAQPYFERLGLAGPADAGRTHHVLLVDGSYSMAFQPGGESLFERAQELAARIVQESPQGDAFTLVLMASPPRVIVGEPAFDDAALAQEIAGLTVSHTSIDLSAALSAAARLVKRVQAEQPRLVRHEVVILSDLGRVGWVLEGSRGDEARRLAGQLAQAASLVVVDVGQPGAENLAVADLRVSDAVVTLARDVQFEAAVKNFSRTARPRQNVELLVDGRRVAEEKVDLPAQGAAAVTFNYRFDLPGDHTVDVRVAGDRLEVDNHRWLAVPVKQFVRVLAIDGRPSGVPFQGATGYLEVALAPREEADVGFVRVEVAPESALVEKPLDGYDCVFLADVAQFTENEARVLASYVQGGGSLVFFLGGQVVAEQYNAQLGRAAEGLPALLPARLGAVAENPAGRQLDPRGYRHPIVAAFRGQEQAGLLTTPVSKYVQLDLPEGAAARVALAMGNGDPLVVEHAVGRGRVVLVATSADTTWTAMPMWPSYVPLVQELLAWCVAGQLAQRNVAVGQPLEGSVPPAAAEVPLVVQTPDGRSEPVRVRPAADGGAWSYGETDTSGIYAARFGRPIGLTLRYAVNLQTAESDLAKVDAEQLREEVWAGVPFVHQTSWQDAEDESLGPLRRQSRLHLGLLYSVLGLVFVESLLAWRLGNRG